MQAEKLGEDEGSAQWVAALASASVTLDQAELASVVRGVQRLSVAYSGHAGVAPAQKTRVPDNTAHYANFMLTLAQLRHA